MYNIFDIANSFLLREPVMPHKKLQKLCYYAYAWYYTLNDKELFVGRFEAWVHGPVDTTLYDKHRGKYEVVFDNIGYRGLDTQTEKFLDSIYDKYGYLSALELEALSHFEAPWKIARGNIPTFQQCKNSIPKEQMKAFYRKAYGDITTTDMDFRHKLKEYWNEYT